MLQNFQIYLLGSKLPIYLIYLELHLILNYTIDVNIY